MRKVNKLFLSFTIVSLLVSVSVIEVQGGACPSTPMNDCVDCCKFRCNAGQYKMDCTGATTGEDRKDCRLLNNIMAQCCYFDCLQEECGTDAGKSIVCAALGETPEESCDQYPCVHDPCAPGDPLVSDCDSGVMYTCGLRPFCCGTEWDDTCTRIYNINLDSPTRGVCDD